MRTYKNVAIAEAIAKLTGDFLFEDMKEIEVKEEDFKFELMKATGIKEATAQKWIDELELLKVVTRKDGDTIKIKTEKYATL